MCVKLEPSGRIHVVFIVGEPEAEEHSSEGEPRKAVGVDLGIGRLATLSDGRILENPRPLERSLDRVRALQRTLSRKKFLSKTGLKQRRNLRRNTSTLRILGVTCSLNSGRYSHRSTTS